MEFNNEFLGREYGRWTVIGPAQETAKGYNYFRLNCRCSCGTTREVLYRSLRTGASKSCGCYNRERSREVLSKPLEIGASYGRWKILSGPEYKNKVTYYLCECECGTSRLVSRDSLIRGTSMSCGCLVSKGEFIIAEWLKVNGLSFARQHSYQDCLSPKGRRLKFDFAVFLPEGEFIIEFQGSQHTKLNPKSGRFLQTEEKFATTQGYDRIKKNYLTTQSIPHLYISYQDIRKIPGILNNTFGKYLPEEV